MAVHLDVARDRDVESRPRPLLPPPVGVGGGEAQGLQKLRGVPLRRRLELEAAVIVDQRHAPCRACKRAAPGRRGGAGSGSTQVLEPGDIVIAIVIVVVRIIIVMKIHIQNNDNQPRPLPLAANKDGRATRSQADGTDRTYLTERGSGVPWTAWPDWMDQTDHSARPALVCSARRFRSALCGEAFAPGGPGRRGAGGPSRRRARSRRSGAPRLPWMPAGAPAATAGCHGRPPGRQLACWPGLPAELPAWLPA